MECNRDEALRAKAIAERKVSEKDYAGARRFALKALNLFPSLEGISQMITILDVYLASEITINGEKDLYAILHVKAFADDEMVKKQYRKLALLLHPDKNKFAGAEGAFQLVSEAWNALSDRSKKSLYDQRIRSKGFQQKPSQPSKPNSASKTDSNGFYQSANLTATKSSGLHRNATTQKHPSAPTAPPPPSHAPLSTFWTSCTRCCMQYEYHLMYLNKSLLCPKCKKPFLATQLPAPPCGPRQPKCPPKQENHSNNKSTSGSMGTNTNSYSGTNLQWPPFTGYPAMSEANGCSSNTAAPAANSSNVVQQAYEKAKRLREETQAMTRREEALRKKFNMSRMNNNIGIGPNLTANRTNCAQTQVDHSFEAAKNTFIVGNKIFGDKVSGDTVSGLRAVANRDFSQADVRPLLMEKAKLQILKKIKELNAAEAPQNKQKEKTKNKQKPKEGNEELIQVNGTLKNTVQTKKKNELKLDLDAEVDQPVSIDVPDPDFNDFDGNRTEKAFEGDQIWATYDDDDGMPRYYALIKKVLSANPFKVHMSFLASKSNEEFAPIDWISNGFSKTCGEFRVVRYEVVDSINIFSHRVNWEKGFRGVIKIFPRKGDTWALYRNWTPHWNKQTPDDVIHKYDMVEVLEDYNEDRGVYVVSLVKVAGFKTVFRRHCNAKEIKTIPKHEMFRFSHQVPSYVLTGEESDNAPKGCIELDPAAASLEILQSLTETKSEEDHMNDDKQ